MAAREFKKVELVAKHTPDESIETDGSGLKHSVELPGSITVGVEIDGTYHALSTFKAGKFLARHDARTAKPDDSGE